MVHLHPSLFFHNLNCGADPQRFVCFPSCRPKEGSGNPGWKVFVAKECDFWCWRRMSFIRIESQQNLLQKEENWSEPGFFAECTLIFTHFTSNLQLAITNNVVRCTTQSVKGIRPPGRYWVHYSLAVQVSLDVEPNWWVLRQKKIN